MIHKVKDALKPGQENDTYNSGHTSSQTHGSHAQSSMPGTFDSSTQDASHSTSKYASEPTQPSYQQDQPYSATQGHGTSTSGAGTTSGLMGHSTKDKHGVRDDNVMDPADRQRGSNVMDRDRNDYGTATSGSQKLHKQTDPRANYDNSGRAARYDQEAILRQQEQDRAGGQAGYGTAHTTSSYDQSGSTGKEPHNSKIMNKLDPRVDSTQTDTYDNSRSTDHDSSRNKHSGTNALGATSAAGTASQHHSSSTRDNHSALPIRSNDEYSNVHRKDVPDSNTRQGDPYNTSSTHHTSGAPFSQTITNPQGLADERHRNKESKHHGTAEPVPYSATGMHTQGRDSISAPFGAMRKHFFCHDCGHKNDTSGLRDPSGQAVTGKAHLFCMHCGHRNHMGSS